MPSQDEFHTPRNLQVSTRYYSRSLAFPVARQTKYWEIIADNLSASGWNWGCVSAGDSCGHTIWIADAHCDDGKHFVVRADEKLTAFLEPERVTRESFRFLNAE